MILVADSLIRWGPDGWQDMLRQTDRAFAFAGAFSQADFVSLRYSSVTEPSHIDVDQR
jgi:hypothetical protein